MKKRILSILLAVLIVVGMFPVTAMANEGKVAKIGDTEYDTLAEAVTAANNGDTIELLSNVALKNVVNMKDGIILDCKGYTISASTENDSYYVGENSMKNPSSSAVALLNIGNDQKVTIKNGIFETQAYARCNIGTGSNSELTLDNVKLIHVEYSSRGNDALQLNGKLIVVNSLIIEMGSNTRYWKDKNGGEVPGGFINRAWGGISFNNDNCSIDFTNCTQFIVTDMSGEAYGLKQAPIHIYHTGNFDKTTIENTFKNVTAPEKINGMVKVIGNAWDMTGFAFTDSEFLMKNYPVKIGDVYFQSIAKAVEYVEDNETITLLDNVTLSENLVISNSKTFALDLGGKTLTGRVNVSGAKLTVKNGTINAGSKKQALNAYGTTDNNYNTTDNLYTYIKVENDVNLVGDYGICFLSSTANSYSAIAYGVKVDFYGTATAFCGAFVSGNIGATSDNRQGTLMHNENAPVFNVYGKLIGNGTGSAEDSTQGISLNGYATVNVYEGAEISGAEAVGVKAGRLNVYGGSLTSTGKKCDPVEAINSGTDASGGAIAVSSTYSAGTGKIIVNVNGGTITSKNNAALLVTHSYTKENAIAFTNGVEVNVNGGKFSGDTYAVFVATKLDGDNNSYPNTGFISGGLYSNQVDEKYIAPDYACIANTDKATNTDYPYIVTVPPTKVEVETGAANVETEGDKKDTVDEKVTTELAGKVKKDVVENIIENASETSTSNIQEKITEEQVQVKDDNQGTKEVTLDESSKTRIDVKLESIQINVGTTEAAPTIVAQCTVTTKTATYDVKPVVTVTTTDGTGATTAETFVITNDWLKKNNKVLAFTLPVPDSMTGDSVLVTHTKENNEVETFNARVEGNEGKRFITINATEFSKYELSQQTEENATAKIKNGDKTYYYSSLANAISDAQNGDTITLLRDSETGTITVDRVVTFTLVLNGKTLKATIKPGDDYVRHIYGDKYYFELYEAGDTIVIGGNRNKDAKADTAKEENPETGAPVLSMSTGIVLAGIALVLAKRK